MPKTRRPIDPRLRGQICNLDFSKHPVAARFIRSIINGPESEIEALGSRGDWKTTAMLTGSFLHAQEHFRQGYPLPVHWMGVTDTFTSHKLKTIRTMESPLWKGMWKLSDGDHVARCVVDGACLVQMDLFGIEDQGAMDRVRMETHCVWFEEPAPSAVMVQSSGVSEEAWNLALTSRRLPSHFKPAVATLNYPDEDHWAWTRWKPSPNLVFAHPEKLREIFKQVDLPAPEELFALYPQGTPVSECHGVTIAGRRWFRFPVGSGASEADRLEWARALAERKDMLRRLILGMPGIILQGQQVAQGFDYDLHVAKESLKVLNGQPLVMGFDFGHTPTCVIGQHDGGTLNILAALHLPNSGMRQLLDEQVLPWLGHFAPWVLRNPDDNALIGYDPSGDTTADADAEQSALKVIQDVLQGGNYEAGPIRWPNRRNALSIFHRTKGIRFDPVWAADLIKACNGRWYYPKTHLGDLRADVPKKPNHPWEDLGDALIYMLCRAGTVTWNERKQPAKVETVFDVFQPARDTVYGEPVVESDFRL